MLSYNRVQLARLLGAAAIILGQFVHFICSQDTAICSGILDGLASLCVTASGADGTCLGPCMTAVRSFNHTCHDHPSLGASATVLTQLIATCPEVRGCMDDRYTNYAVESNSQKSGDCVDEDAPVFSLVGDSEMTILQICGLSSRRLAPCQEINATFVDPWAIAQDAVDGNLSAAVVRSGEVDIYTPGEYTLFYRVSDTAANEAGKKRRYVTVVGYGCTNASSFNFDPDATVDAGNCQDFHFGCQNPLALNYDSAANTDGCVHGERCNNQPATAVMNVSGFPTIEYEIVGRGSWCECKPGFSGLHCEIDIDECASQPCSDNTVSCIDGRGYFYCECEAGWRETTCIEEVVACSSSQNVCADRDLCFVSDGTSKCDCAPDEAWNSTTLECAQLDRCASSPCVNGGTCTDSTYWFTCLCPVGFAGVSCQLSSDVCAPNSCVERVYGCMDPTMWNFAANANTHDENNAAFVDEQGFKCADWGGGCATAEADYGYTAAGAAAIIAACRASCATDSGELECNGSNDMECTSCIPYVYGCKDPSQFNFDPDVNEDDGSCQPFVYGCTEPTAFNYNSEANCGSPEWYRVGKVLRRCELTDVCISRSFGCTDPLMKNYDATRNTDDGSCYPFVYGCTNPEAFDYVAAANTETFCTLYGCTSSRAQNFDPAANTEDGSCVILGCVNTRADNFDPAATHDNNTCVVSGCVDPFSHNYDSHATSDDGSCDMAEYGCMAESSSNYRESANVEDGSCTDHCINDIGWLDSDGEGCSRYYLSYCGFEDSPKRCPTICGSYDMTSRSIVCDVDVRMGCDGVAGSGATVDQCGICAGESVRCADCARSLEYFCNRLVDVPELLATDTVDACVQRIATYGGRMLLDKVVLTALDCVKSLYGWELAGYKTKAQCIFKVDARPECFSESLALTGESPVECVPQARHLSTTAWSEHCTDSFNRTAMLCYPELLDIYRLGSGCRQLGFQAADYVSLNFGSLSCQNSEVVPTCDLLMQLPYNFSCTVGLEQVLKSSTSAGLPRDTPLSSICPLTCGTCQTAAGPAQLYDLNSEGWLACENLPCTVDYEFSGCNSSYDLRIEYARGVTSAGRLQLSLNFGSESAESQLLSTGDWHTTTHITFRVHLRDGPNTMRLTDHGGSHFKGFSMTLLGPHDATLPTTSGIYSYDIAMSIANGLFGSADGTAKDCNPQCLYDLNEPAQKGWEWVNAGGCWTEIVDN